MYCAKTAIMLVQGEALSSPVRNTTVYVCAYQWSSKLNAKGRAGKRAGQRERLLERDLEGDLERERRWLGEGLRDPLTRMYAVSP